jgi:hypothetical protein
MSLRNRRSPSGPTSEVQLPIYGTNTLTTAVTEFLTVGEMSSSVTELDGQAAIPQTGYLTSVTIQNVVPGGVGTLAADKVAYEVRLNGVLIVPDPVNFPLVTASATVPNLSQEPFVIPCNTPVIGPTATVAGPPIVPAKHDLISVKAIPTINWLGTSPAVRVVVKYSPGGPL